MIVLNSLNAITELFNKRGAKHSDRPRSVMAGEMFVIIKLFSFSVACSNCGLAYAFPLNLTPNELLCLNITYVTEWE